MLIKTQKTNDCVHALNQSLLHIILLGDYIEQGGGDQNKRKINN